MTAVSAASRTTGLALKAIPKPAAASMSRSLAPSPTATVCSTGMPRSAATRRSRSAFPALSITGPSSSPVRTPSAISRRLANVRSTSRSAPSAATKNSNPPLTSTIS